MNRKAKSILCVVVSFSLSGALAFAGGGLAIPWHSIDGGGAMQSAGGTLTLSGTIGQHDANDPVTALTGGSFILVGGFWAAAVPVCGCLADVNDDGERNAADVQGFIDCLTAAGTNCGCADVDGFDGLDINDVAVFVDDLIIGASCP